MKDPLPPKLSSLRPPRATTTFIPTIPIRRKKEVPTEEAVKRVYVKKTVARAELTASGPFSMGPALAGSRRGASLATPGESSAGRNSGNGGFNGGGISSGGAGTGGGSAGAGSRLDKEDSSSEEEGDELGIEEKSIWDPVTITRKVRKDPLGTQTPKSVLKPIVKRESNIDEIAMHSIDSSISLDTFDESVESSAEILTPSPVFSQMVVEGLKEMPLDLPFVPGPTEETYLKLPPGHLGEWIIRRSGKMSLILNGVEFDVASSTGNGKVCTIERDAGRMIVIGEVGERMIVTPNLKGLGII